MDRAYVLAGFLMILFAGFVGADSISSTIICDGASFVSSSVMGQGETYASSLFTTHLSSLFRDTQVMNGDVKTRVLAESSGPMGIDEFSERAANNTRRKEGCVFSDYENRTGAMGEIMHTGLMRAGVYVSARDMRPVGVLSDMMINGSGMFLVRASSKDPGNETIHSSDIAGNMNMTERIVFGKAWI